MGTPGLDGVRCRNGCCVCLAREACSQLGEVTGSRKAGVDVRRVAVAAGIGLACQSAGINGGVASSHPSVRYPVSSDSSDDDANQRDM